MVTKKRTLSAAGRKKIAEAQKRRWADKQPAATGPVQHQDTQETDADAARRFAAEAMRLQGIIRAHEVCIEDDRESLADYAGILKRELAYHKLRVDELTRDLRLNCIEV